jgi:hypothetical protein
MPRRKKQLARPPRMRLFILSKNIHLKNAGLKKIVCNPWGVLTLVNSQELPGIPSGYCRMYFLQRIKGIKLSRKKR